MVGAPVPKQERFNNLSFIMKHHINSALVGFVLATCLLLGAITGRVFMPEPLAVVPMRHDPQVLAAREKAVDMKVLTGHLAQKYKRPESEVRDIVSLAFREASKHSISPLLVLAIIEQESSLSPTAGSFYGALGLMQVVPRFHQEKMARPHEPESLFRPSENIRVGTAIVAEYLRKANGNLEKALRYYSGNAKQYFAKVERNRVKLAQVLHKSRQDPGREQAV